MRRIFSDPLLVKEIRLGAVGVIPTDTLYGLVASARHPEAVERVYALKGRDSDKPCIILIDRPETALQFGIDRQSLHYIAPLWPAPLSVIFPAFSEKYCYLQRNGKMPPFRVPADRALREFLARSGPLIAPSANMQGQPPATVVEEAEAVFGNKVDFYVDGGVHQGAPSTLVRVVREGKLEVVRPGAFEVPKELLIPE